MLALVDAEQLAAAHQLVELGLVHGLEQVMTAQDLVMDAMEHHLNLGAHRGRGVEVNPVALGAA
ncbi:hypothetical protein cym2001_35750 [Pseudomonas sp. CYM-20-01]|nr:hypothetical protein cym2001_35750 [Pseudomonas sp. CYM-20-01]